MGTSQCSNNSICVNTIGGYTCECDVGYTLQDDQITCLRKCGYFYVCLSESAYMRGIHI